MPTYDYTCQSCEYQMEAFHSMSAEPLRDCPACGKPDLKRMIGTGAGIIFKGSGFYQTDYRSDGYKKSAQADASGSGGEASSKKDSATGTSAPKASPGSSDASA